MVTSSSHANGSSLFLSGCLERVTATTSYKASIFHVKRPRLRAEGLVVNIVSPELLVERA